MTEETINEIIRAFAFGVPIETIAANVELTKKEVIQFADDYKERIAEVMTYNAEKTGV